MPEAPEVFAFLTKVERMIQEEKRRIGRIPEARLRLFPRCFALGTKTKHYSSISINSDGFFYCLEPLDPEYKPNSHDIVSARRTGCLPYVDRPLTPGPLVCAVRGKCLVLAAGYHAVSINFGLESSVYVLSRADYEDLIELDGPGSNPSKSKAERLRSFRVPPRLIVPGSSTDKPRIINIFCAFILERYAVIVADSARLVRLHVTSACRFWAEEHFRVDGYWWRKLLFERFPDGPDWVLETDASFRRLDDWRSRCLERSSSEPIVKAITSNTSDVFSDKAVTSETGSKPDISGAFGGLGRHLANDFLYYAAIPPGLSASAVCADELMWGRLRGGILPYMQKWRHPDFISRCITTTNSTNPFAFNQISNANYLSLYTKVYYKKYIRMPASVYNQYLELGYLDPDHTIGTPYTVDVQAHLLAPKGHRDVAVHHVQIGGGLMAFTAIVAKPPSSEMWWSTSNATWKDIQARGQSTTVGPASFHETIANRIHPDSDVLKPKVGRPPKVKTGKRGRPSTGKSLARVAKVPRRISSCENKENLDRDEHSDEDWPSLEMSPKAQPSPRKTRSSRKTGAR